MPGKLQPPQIDPRLKDNRVIAAGIVVLLLVLTLAYYLIQRGRGVAGSALEDRMALVVLGYVNVILILIVLFILFRSLFRLIIDHRSRILGSKFKTKLVLSAVFLSLIPVLILYPVAARVLVRSLEAWYSLPIEAVVEEGRQTAEALDQWIEATNLRDAKRVLDSVLDLDLEDLSQHPDLKQRMQSLREELQADYLAVYDSEAFIWATADPLKMRNSPNVRRGLSRFLRDAIEHGEAKQVADDLGIDGRLILAARAAPRNTVADDTTPAGELQEENSVPPPPFTVVMLGTLLPPDIAETSESLLRAYQLYLRREVQQEELSTTYRSLLLMMTLLVLLAFTSISLRLARRVTVPIQALADGTRRIRAGDLDHRVEVAVDDELGVLVDGFNRMTRELKSNRELVEQSNRDLVDANELLDTVLQNVGAGVLSIDAKGTILTSNNAARRILAQRSDELVGHRVADAWADPQRQKLVELLAHELDGGELSAEVRLAVGGTWKTLEARITSLPDTASAPGGCVLVLEDLTELMQAQKMATWNEVARRIAHEIKNPLTPIKLTAERLLRKHQQAHPGLGVALEEGVETIVREVGTLKNMVDEFSRFARMPRPHPTQVDLEQLVTETLSLYAGIKPGVELEYEIGAEAGFALFDPSQLKSVLINLLDNALQAVEPPGKIIVSSHRVDHAVHLRVADTGQGVHDESKDKLFLPYFSTKGRGTGLGLAIVHRIVTDHNAIIRVEDNRPKGTVFVLEMPAQ